MQKIIEKLAHFFSGYNLVIGPHIRKQLKFVREIIPEGFKHREMDDLGCGDGKVTLLLKDIFLPEKLRAFDINPALVKRAQAKGIQAEVKNLEEEIPNGELAVMWGVLHHLNDMGACLEGIKENYNLIFIREPLKTGNVNLMEMGHPLRQEDIETLFKEHLPDSQIFYCGNSILIFYVSKIN
jgi:SAM-dependent methyltransferase